MIPTSTTIAADRRRPVVPWRWMTSLRTLGRLLLWVVWLVSWPGLGTAAEPGLARIIHGWTNYSTGFSATIDMDPEAGDGATVASIYTPSRHERLHEYAVIVVWLGDRGPFPGWDEFRYRIGVWSGLSAFIQSPATGDVATVHFDALPGGEPVTRNATTRGGRPAYELRFPLAGAGIDLIPARTYLVGFAASTFVEESGELYVPTAPTSGPSDVQAGDRVPRGWQYLTNAGGLTIYSGQLAVELLVEPRPQLRIARAGPDTVAVTWPASLASCVLEAIDPVASESFWLPVSGAVTNPPGWTGLVTTSPAASRLFRLRVIPP